MELTGNVERFEVTVSPHSMDFPSRFLIPHFPLSSLLRFFHFLGTQLSSFLMNCIAWVFSFPSHLPSDSVLFASSLQGLSLYFWFLLW